MSSALATRVVPARFQGFRPCASRPGWCELIVRVAGHRLSWCVPLGVDDGDGDPGTGIDRVALERHPATGVSIVESTTDGGTTVISAARMLRLLAGPRPPRVVVDERLAALYG